MEKLIELLNEYCKEKEFNTEWYEWKFWPKVKPYEHLTQWVVNWIIIWNHYWFIKWLVENDKIYYDKVREKSDFFPVEKVPEYNSYSDYESLLMLLSIQDKPIDFLISILK